MPASFTTIKSMVMEHIKSSVVYGTYATNPNYQENYIDDEIRKANDDVVAAVCSNPSHSRRVDYITSQAVTAVANGGQLPSSIGGWSNIRIKRSDNVMVNGKPLKAELIDLLRTLVNVNIAIKDKEGYYNRVGTVLYFTGSTAGVDFCSPPSAVGTTLTAPDEYETPIKDLALSRFYMKHEDKPSSAEFYLKLSMSIINAVASESETIPTI